MKFVPFRQQRGAAKKCGKLLLPHILDSMSVQITTRSKTPVCRYTEGVSRLTRRKFESLRYDD